MRGPGALHLHIFYLSFFCIYFSFLVFSLCGLWKMVGLIVIKNGVFTLSQKHCMFMKSKRVKLNESE